MFLSDSELLNAVKEKFGHCSDVELAKLLRVANTVISAVRASRRKLPDYSRVVAFDLLDYWWAKWVLKYAFHEDVDMALLDDRGGDQDDAITRQVHH